MTTPVSLLVHPHQHHRRSRLVLLTAALLAMMVGFSCIAIATAPRALAEPVIRTVRVSVFDTPCQDVVFVGARGSGASPDTDNGMGSQVNAAFQDFEVKLKSSVGALNGDSAAEVRLGYYPVIFSAAAVSTLFPPATTPFFDSIDGGVVNTVSFLNARIRQCPQERYVLSGHSQGAMVMHRVIQYLSDHYTFSNIGDVNANNRILSRVSSVIAIADGDRNGSDSATYLGTAGVKDHSGIGKFDSQNNPWQEEIVGGAFPNTGNPLPDSSSWSSHVQYLSICLSGDPICDFSGVVASAIGQEKPGPLWSVRLLAALSRKVQIGLKIHSSYDSSSYLEQAVSASAHLVAPQISDQFRIRAVGQPPTGTVGKSYTFQVGALGGTPPYSYLAAHLPKNLAMNRATGLISGIPLQATTSNVTLMVRDQSGQMRQQVIRMTVSPTPPTGSFPSVQAPAPSRFSVPTDDFTSVAYDSGWREQQGTGFGPDGSLTYCEGNGLATVSRDGTVSQYANIPCSFNEVTRDSGGRYFVRSGDNAQTTTAYSPALQELWSGAYSDFAIAPGGKIAVAARGDGKLVGIDPKTGTVKWERSRQDGPYGFSGGMLVTFLGTYIDFNTGTTIADISGIPSDHRGSTLSISGQIFTATAEVGSNRCDEVGVSLFSTQGLQWKRMIPQDGSSCDESVFADGVGGVYVVVHFNDFTPQQEKVYRFDATGKQLWISNAVGGEYWSVDAGGTLVQAESYWNGPGCDPDCATKSEVHAFDPKTGAVSTVATFGSLNAGSWADVEGLLLGGGQIWLTVDHAGPDSDTIESVPFSATGSFQNTQGVRS